MKQQANFQKTCLKSNKTKNRGIFSESFDPPRGFVKNSFELPPSIFNPCASLNAITLKLGWSKFLSNSTVVFPKVVLKSNIKKLISEEEHSKERQDR